MDFSPYKTFFVYKLENNTKLTTLLSFGMNEVTTRHQWIMTT